MKEKEKWGFLSNIDTLSAFSPQRFESKRVKKELSILGIVLSKKYKEKLELTPFVFSINHDKAAIIFEDYVYLPHNRFQILNRIICFYEFDGDNWKEIYAWPVTIY